MATALQMAPMEKEMDRQQRFWQKIVDKRQRMKLSLHRARLVTASYKETEGLP